MKGSHNSPGPGPGEGESPLAWPGLATPPLPPGISLLPATAAPPSLAPSYSGPSPSPPAGLGPSAMVGVMLRAGGTSFLLAGIAAAPAASASSLARAPPQQRRHHRRRHRSARRATRGRGCEQGLGHVPGPEESGRGRGGISATRETHWLASRGKTTTPPLSRGSAFDWSCSPECQAELSPPLLFSRLRKKRERIGAEEAARRNIARMWLSSSPPTPLR